MKRPLFLTAFIDLVLVMFSGCASLHSWPNYERSAESKMVVIQENIGDGLKSNALSPDQSQMFLKSLKVVRTDYVELRDKKVDRDKWEALNKRLDVLSEEMDKVFAQTAKIEGPKTEPRNGERIGALQRTIDDGTYTRRFPATDAREFQALLDSIRQEYLRMVEGNTPITLADRDAITRRLDALATDVNRTR
jgi:hypothetical protein